MERGGRLVGLLLIPIGHNRSSEQSSPSRRSFFGERRQRPLTMLHEHVQERGKFFEHTFHTVAVSVKEREEEGAPHRAVPVPCMATTCHQERRGEEGSETSSEWRRAR